MKEEMNFNQIAERAAGKVWNYFLNERQHPDDTKRIAAIILVAIEEATVSNQEWAKDLYELIKSEPLATLLKREASRATTDDTKRVLELLQSDHIQNNKHRMGALAVSDLDAAIDAMKDKK